MPTFDVAIIGGGIVGLATAYRYLMRRPGASLVLLEKEKSLAFHQTGRNSGVLHSGIYYRPGTLRAQNCRTGKAAMVAFCQAEGVPYDLCGKVIVAIDESELPALERIQERGKQNGVMCEVIDRKQLLELEPRAAGIRAIHVPESGIVDYPAVCARLAARIKEAGGQIVLGARVWEFSRRPEAISLSATPDRYEARTVVNCTGLYSDRVTMLSGIRPKVKIVPFRGEYYDLKPEARGLVRNLIYPVPDARFPFLGVHFTRLISGGVECGPNAVLAFAREGYRMRDVNLGDLFESLTYSGFLRMAAKYWRVGAGEMWRSMSKAAFVKALARLLPDIRAEHLEPAPSGVRAQAVSREGELVDDFVIEEGDRVINVCNAASPAATAALNIGDLIVDRLEGKGKGKAEG